jgi:predicted DNA-binding protein with PD1-like motif
MRKLLLLLLLATPVYAQTTPMQTFVLRIKPGEDLKQTLQRAVRNHHVLAGCVLSCAGSLERVRLRLADQNHSTDFPGKHEIVSLGGTLSPEGLHLHMAASDETGRTVGGHLVEGNIVYTTAEIVVGVFSELRFHRVLDRRTGSRELRVERKTRRRRTIRPDEF